jgi:hypothetical protein
LERSIRYFLLDNEINRSQRKFRCQTFQLLLRLIRKSLHWRLKHSFFEFPLELWLSLAKKRLVVRRSLLTGQPLSRELARTPSISTLEVQLHPQLNNTRRASRRDGPEGAVRVQAIGWREAENFRIQKEKLPRRWPALCRIGKTFSPDSRF